VVASVGIHVVVYTVIFNYFATMQGDYGAIFRSLPVRFIAMGSLCYLVTCIQCAVQVTMSAQEIIHFTDWVPGHAHLVLFGTFSFWIFAWFYYLWPRLFKTQIFSESLGNWQFWLATLGVWMMWIDLGAAGVMQGYMWKALVPFTEVLQASRIFWWTRAVAGTLILISEVLFAVNMYMTWKYRNVRLSEEALNAPLKFRDEGVVS
jgi:cytochrome c oxidase cbb3-type subunit I